MERERSLRIRVWAVGLGFVLLIYGGISISLGLGRPGITAAGWCAAWLCPEEFSDARVSVLLQESTGARAANAVAELKRALDFDSASAYRWANLGEALFNAGNMQPARYSFLRAVDAGPGNPAILMRAANFWFSAGDFRKMMQCGSAILQNPRLAGYYTATFLTYARAGAPIEEILAQGIPPRRAAAQAFLRFLMEGTQSADAAAAWKWITERDFYDDPLTGDYLDFLLRNREGGRAAEIWAYLNRAGMPDYRRTNWIYDGSFETAPRPSPLDWHIETGGNVEAARVAGGAQDGRWALELTFDGTNNLDYHGPWQQAVLAKGRWHAEAFLRTERITTDQGVGLRIFNPAAPQTLDVHTDYLTGTAAWTKVEKTFDIAQDTAVVRVEATRQPSPKFDNKIAGKAWIDSIKIERVR